MLFALFNESDQHLLSQAIVGLLTAVTTLIGVVTYMKAITRQQTKRLVGTDPRTGEASERINLGSVTRQVAGIEYEVTSLREAFNAHVAEDKAAFARLDNTKADKPIPVEIVQQSAGAVLVPKPT